MCVINSREIRPKMSIRRIKFIAPKKMQNHLPTVVRSVPAKKKAPPNVQFGPEVTFFSDQIPCKAASRMLANSLSISSSEMWGDLGTIEWEFDKNKPDIPLD